MRILRVIESVQRLQALQKYTTIVKEYSDLALAERARIKRALMLYETGAVEQALLELEDEEIALRGNAEVHLSLLGAAQMLSIQALHKQQEEDLEVPQPC